jgi:hypothetical protein
MRNTTLSQNNEYVVSTLPCQYLNGKCNDEEREMGDDSLLQMCFVVSPRTEDGGRCGGSGGECCCLSA